MKYLKLKLIFIGLFVIGGLSAQQLTEEKDVFAPYLTKDASPRVWWHWMDGNVTKEGIRKDLFWMKNTGIAGFHHFNAALHTKQIVPNKVTYFKKDWEEMFNYALDLADSLQLEVSVTSSPGWSITGGPWVSKEDAQKKIVWREMLIDGGRKFKGKLPKPYTCAGPYQDLYAFPQNPDSFQYYQDIAVIAVRLTDDDPLLHPLKAMYTTNDPDFDVRLLTDQVLHTSAVLKAAADEYAWVQIEFEQPQTIRSFSIAENSQNDLVLEFSMDGKTFYPSNYNIPAPIPYFRIFDISPITAKYFRFRSREKGSALHLAELRLSPQIQVNASLDKTGFHTVYFISDNFPTPRVENAPQLCDVVDVTSFVKDGVLQWNVPKGKWLIYRFGYNLLGHRNGPAPAEATGLEADKLSAEAMRHYYQHYLSKMDSASQHRLGSVIRWLMIDSYEAGRQTWTKNLPTEFEHRRGYSLMPWLPVLTGRIIGSSEESERFLFDWRQTLGELMAENHYDLVKELLSAYDMKFHSESHEEHRHFVGDGMRVKRLADIPMSAFWTRYAAGWHSMVPICEADVRESASVAHIYGQNICAAESFTTNGRIGKWDGTRAYSGSPANLKALADGAMASGLNRFIIHSMVHQPMDTVFPGLGLSTYGQWFNRHETWADFAHAWISYLHRTSSMLQQGKFVADYAYFYGEGKNVQALYAYPRVPATSGYDNQRFPEAKGYSYDFINDEILLNVLQVENKCLTTATGMRYKMLVLDENIKYMSLQVLHRLAECVAAGVPLCGKRPLACANLQADTVEFNRLVKIIWESGNPQVYENVSIETALKQAGIAPSVEFPAATPSDVRFVHRRLPQGEMYWIANITPENQQLSLSFDVAGFRPEIWRAESKDAENVAYEVRNGRTYLTLTMTPDDACFVMFVRPSTETSFIQTKPSEQEILALDGAWKLKFQEGRGAPESVVFPHLISYTEASSDSIRYFSGVATYEKTFTLSKKQFDHDDAYILDLGKVGHMAEVWVNGQNVGVLWHSPYRMDVSNFLQEGKNTLQIKVANAWVNRLIGDEQPQTTRRITYTEQHFYNADDALLPSGLIGPVRLMQKKEGLH